MDRGLPERKEFATIRPNDNLALDTMSNKPLYRLLTRGRLRMVLGGTEEELRTTKAEDQAVASDLTIEHTRPRSWRGVRPRPEPGVEPEGPEERRDRLLDSLGKPTHVTQPPNSALSNGSWVSKRKGLVDHSTLFLNKDLLAHTGDDEWDEEAIHARATRLRRAFVSAWSHP